MYAINLSWEQSNDILMWAIHEKAHMRITLRMAREWMEMPSEFFDGELLKTIMIRKFPAIWTQKMLAGQLLPCSFRKGHRKYLFVSAIIDQKQIEIDGKKEETYILAWPEGVQQVQRRLYFRATVPLEMELNVKVWPSVAAIDQTPTEEPIGSGRLVDISAGGCLMEFSSPNALLMEKSYLLEIALPKPEQPVLIQGQVKRESNSSNDQQYGMQFLSLDKSPRGQETLMRLARFTNYLRSLQQMENFNESPKEK